MYYKGPTYFERINRDVPLRKVNRILRIIVVACDDARVVDHAGKDLKQRYTRWEKGRSVIDSRRATRIAGNWN